MSIAEGRPKFSTSLSTRARAVLSSVMPLICIASSHHVNWSTYVETKKYQSNSDKGFTESR